jgi:hypothetical protein
MPLTIVAGYRPATTALGQLPDRCVFRRTRLPRSYLEEGPCTLRRPNLTPRNSSGNHHAHIESRRPQRSNPHRSSAPHRRAPSGPRFPPLRLLGRLPPERVAPFISGRRPRTLNKDRHVIRIFEAVAERAPPVGEMVVTSIGGGVRHHAGGESRKTYRAAIFPSRTIMTSSPA